jgi:hypothetical protein
VEDLRTRLEGYLAVVNMMALEELAEAEQRLLVPDLFSDRTSSIGISATDRSAA